MWGQLCSRKTAPVIGIINNSTESMASRLPDPTPGNRETKVATINCRNWILSDALVSSPVQSNVQLANPDLSLETINYVKLDWDFNELHCRGVFQDLLLVRQWTQSVSLISVEQTFLRGSGQTELMNSNNWFLQNRKIISSLPPADSNQLWSTCWWKHSR